MAEIVPFAPERLEQVVALSIRVWAPVFAEMRKVMLPAVYDAFYPHGWEVRQRADVSAACENSGISVWVALEDDEAAGFVAVAIHPEDRMGAVHMIAVDPDRQRSGIASELMDFALDRMREAGMAIALVETGFDDGHLPARCLYERHGFTLWLAARYVTAL